MPATSKKNPNKTPRASREPDQHVPLSDSLDQFQRGQSELWRLTFLLLLVIGSVFAAVSWSTIRSLAYHFEALPIGLVILILLFGAYAYKRTQELSELRGMVRGLEQRDAAPPSGRQMDQLFAVIERSQQGYRDLIDSFDDVLLALSLDGEIRAVNRSFADLVGLSFQEIIGRPVTDILEEAAGEGRDLVDRELPRFLERRHWMGIVHIRLKGHQSTFYYDCVAHAMLRNGEVHGVTLLARDITAKRKSEARFTELFETLHEGIYILTPDEHIIDANPALVRMLGFESKEALLKCSLADILPDPSQRELLRQEVDTRPMLQGREITLLRRDGRPLICLNTAAAVRDAGGRILRYHGAVMDITERREMERRLYQQQEFARRLVDNFPDLILVVDTQGNFTFTSPRIKDILGYEPLDSDMLPLGQRTHIEDRPALAVLFAEIISGRKSFDSIELRMQHKLGEWRRMRLHISPFSNENGKIDGAIISGRDVTELKRLEDQLIQAEKLAAIGQMLAGVAHELNNPLTAILGVTELLRERAGIDEGAKRQLDLTHRQARRAARIVQNLLEFSRPAAPQKKLLDVNTLLERTLQLHQHSLRRNNVEVDFQPYGALPVVLGDTNQLIQIFLNLISNAEHAIREAGESGRIVIRIGRMGTNVSVTVQDNGVGIAPEALARVFDPFYTTKRPGGGTGLGLSICLSIVREHGGSIEVEAAPGGGTAFIVLLPIAADQQAPADATDPGFSLSPFRSVATGFKGRNVLVLDDEESIRMLLHEGLSMHGLRVECVATAAEALEAARLRPFDVLLCDLNLSSEGLAVDGQQAAKQILAASARKKPEVIFMTGDLAEAPMPGEPRRLQKPFRISDVLAIFRDIFAGVPGEPIRR
jgi:PAS domain S-box-containing protein